MQQAKVVFDQAMQTGYHMKFLDIGGGFQDSSFEMLASAIREAMQLYFHSGITVIAEPGRLYARSVYTLFCKVISRRRQIGKETQPDMLYQNDGVYGSFMNVLIEKETMSPVLLKSNFDLARGGGEHWYSIWGPTCDSVDCVVRRTRVDSEIQVGDWLMYRSMGGERVPGC